jgi:hypothetical protein
VREQIAAQGDVGLKTRVLRGVTEGVCRHYLWSNFASLPVQHELSVLAPGGSCGAWTRRRFANSPTW